MTTTAWKLTAVGGLIFFVVCCCVPAGLTGGYFVFREKPGAVLPVKPVNKISRENFNKITDGMSIKQVVEILGEGKRPPGDKENPWLEWRTDRTSIIITFDRHGRVSRRDFSEWN